VLLDWLGPGARGRALVGAEVGVWRGETARILLRELPGLTLYLIDPWRAGRAELAGCQDDCDRAMADACAATAFAGPRRVVVAGPHEEVAPALPGGLDLVFLDADHSEAATREAIETWWPKVAAGGLLAGHDYGNPNYPGVRAAVDAFARRRGLRVRTGPDLTWCYEASPREQESGDARRRRGDTHERP
jgi:hypothetical protein